MKYFERNSDKQIEDLNENKENTIMEPFGIEWLIEKEKKQKFTNTIKNTMNK
jgi:hypothetical protein